MKVRSPILYLRVFTHLTSIGGFRIMFLPLTLLLLYSGGVVLTWWFFKDGLNSP